MVRVGRSGLDDTRRWPSGWSWRRTTSADFSGFACRERVEGRHTAQQSIHPIGAGAGIWSRTVTSHTVWRGFNISFFSPSHLQHDQVGIGRISIDPAGGARRLSDGEGVHEHELTCAMPTAREWPNAAIHRWVRDVAKCAWVPYKDESQARLLWDLPNGTSSCMLATIWGW